MRMAAVIEMEDAKVGNKKKRPDKARRGPGKMGVVPNDLHFPSIVRSPFVFVLGPRNLMLRMLQSALRRGTDPAPAIARTPAALRTSLLPRHFSLLCRPLQPQHSTRPKLAKAPKAAKPLKAPKVFKASKQSNAKEPYKPRKSKGPVLSETRVTFQLPVSPENATASKSPSSPIHLPFDKLLVMVRAADVVSRMEMPEELPDFPLPPLPDIYDRELLRQVFTHTSYVGARKQSALFDKEAFHHDNEKLEHVGDALLGECGSIG